jgi:hypothetical protein
MGRLLKFVAVLLLMTIGIIPVLAAAPCSEDVTPEMQCPPGCPMMTIGPNASPATQLQSQNPIPSCCDLSSGKPIRTADLQTPSATATASITPPLATVALLATTGFGAEDESLFRLPDLGSHQALLCTFLI